jgi:hypothetical protein
VRSWPFERLAGAAAIAVAMGAFVYALLFVYIVEDAPSWISELWTFILLAGGLATVPVLIAVYFRLRETSVGLALTALVFGLAGSLFGVLHGAYYLGVKVTPPGRYDADVVAGPDDKGVFRYAVAGIALILVSWLIQEGGAFPRGLAYLGYLSGAVLVFIYVGRLYDFITPDDYVSLIPPLVYGLVLHPLWYFWIGRELLRGIAATYSRETRTA